MEGTMEWSLRIPGAPSPWTVQIAKAARVSGFTNMQAWQAQIQAHARQQWQGPPLEGAVVVDTTFYRGWPKHAPKQREKARWSLRHIITTPDVGNYRKAFLDALQGIVYINDSQVLAGTERKCYTTAKEGYTLVTIEQCGPDYMVLWEEEDDTAPA